MKQNLSKKTYQIKTYQNKTYQNKTNQNKTYHDKTYLTTKLIKTKLIITKLIKTIKLINIQNLSNPKLIKITANLFLQFIVSSIFLPKKGVFKGGGHNIFLARKKCPPPTKMLSHALKL